MNKLKKKYTINLLNYNFFLKNVLKKNKNLQKNLFENIILLNNNNLNVIELNNINILINNKQQNIYTIQDIYKNEFLFNYNLNFNILTYFNKIIIKHFLKKNKIIKGRITGGTNEKVYLYVYGYILSMNPKHLNNICNSKKKTFNLNKLKKKGYYSFIKIIKAKQIIKCYKLRNLNFYLNIFNNVDLKKKTTLSRTLYLERLLKNKESKKNNLNYKKKSTLSRKLHVLKINNK